MARRLSRNECATLVGLAPATLATYVSERRGPPFVKVGRTILYDEDEVLRWLDARTVRVEFPAVPFGQPREPEPA